MKKLLIAVCSLLSISLLGGCSVRELPEDGGVDPTIVHTEIVLLPGADMTPFDVPEFSTRAADPREYKVRYIVEVYADDKFDQSLQFRRQLICDEGDTEDVTLECDLHARNYRVVAWRDFVLASGVSGNVADDCFYTTSDFSAVKLKGDYTGGTDYKDVFCGQVALDLSPYRCQSEAGHREEMQLERPLAKVELITTDIVKYLNKLEQTKSIRDAAIDDFTVQGASTIRHNRARGTHNVELMSEIVAELTRANMSDQWIMRHIGMDRDELLRLKQITGLADLFADKEFSLGDTDEDSVEEMLEV